MRCCSPRWFSGQLARALVPTNAVDLTAERVRTKRFVVRYFGWPAAASRSMAGLTAPARVHRPHLIPSSDSPRALCAQISCRRRENADLPICAACSRFFIRVPIQPLILACWAVIIRQFPERAPSVAVADALAVFVDSSRRR